MVRDSEKDLERQLNREVKRMGGKSLKLYNPWDVGLPDRMVLMPGGRVVFVEMKSTGEKPRAIQRVKHEELRRLGYEVRVIDKLVELTEFFNDLQTAYIPGESD